jgi:hypothetical protein
MASAVISGQRGQGNKHIPIFTTCTKSCISHLHFTEKEAENLPRFTLADGPLLHNMLYVLEI